MHQKRVTDNAQNVCRDVQIDDSTPTGFEVQRSGFRVRSGSGCHGREEAAPDARADLQTAGAESIAKPAHMRSRIALWRGLLCWNTVCEQRSLRYDRDIKVGLYTRAGIRKTWLVDLQNERVDVFTPATPQYCRTERLKTSRSLIDPCRGLEGVI